MEASTIKTQYPATYYDMLRWCQIEMEDYPEQVREISTPENYLEHLCSHPRLLLDYFDSKSFYLEVYRNPKGGWSWEIIGKEKPLGIASNNNDSRLEAEGSALQDLFTQVEKQLNNGFN